MPEAIVKQGTHLVTLGTKTIARSGFRFDALREYLETRLVPPLQSSRKQFRPWASVEDLARVFFDRADKKTCSQIRRRLTWARLRFIDANLFLVVQYDMGAGKGSKSHRKILAVKLFDKEREDDRQYAQLQLSQMIKRGELKKQQIQKAEQLVFGFVSASQQ